MVLRTFSEGINTDDSFSPPVREFSSKVLKSSYETILENVAKGKPFFKGQPITEKMFKEAQDKLYKSIMHITDGGQKDLAIEIGKKAAGKWEKLLASNFRTPSRRAAKSTAIKLTKHLAKKSGIKLAAKTVMRIATKFMPWLWGISIGLDIVDLASTPEARALWKEIVEATPEVKRARAKAGLEMEKTRAGVYGEYYHRSVGWY